MQIKYQRLIEPVHLFNNYTNCVELLRRLSAAVRELISARE